MVWKFLGAVYLQRATYQLGLQSLSSKPEWQALHLITNRPGESGFASVLNNKLIDCVLKFILDFFAFLFEKNDECSSVNVHRSALSAYHKKVDKYPVGQYPKVC